MRLARATTPAASASADLPLSFDDALTRLTAVNARMAKVVECRFFGGLSEQETADALDTSLRTVQREWMRARAWLQAERSGAPGRGDP